MSQSQSTSTAHPPAPMPARETVRQWRDMPEAQFAEYAPEIAAQMAPRDPDRANAILAEMCALRSAARLAAELRALRTLAELNRLRARYAPAVARRRAITREWYADRAARFSKPRPVVTITPPVNCKLEVLPPDPRIRPVPPCDDEPPPHRAVGTAPVGNAGRSWSLKTLSDIGRGDRASRWTELGDGERWGWVTAEHGIVREAVARRVVFQLPDWDRMWAESAGGAWGAER